MANWSYTLLQLVQKASFAAGNFKVKIESLSNPDEATQHMIECVNEVIRKIWQAKATPWNQGSAQLQIKEAYSQAGGAPYAAATVTFTKGSATTTVNGTGVGTYYADWVNRVIWLASTSSNAGFMRVTAAVSGGADVITLTCLGTWPYATATTNATWVAALDRYELAADFGDFLTAVTIPKDAMGVASATPSRTLKITDIHEIERLRYTMRSAANTLGNPTAITIAEKSANKLWLAEVDPFPEDEGMIQYRYKKVPAVLSVDADVIPIPDENYDLLANGVIALWQQRTGVQGKEQAFEQWKRTDLAEYVSLGRKLTDGRSGIVPADTMRSSGSAII
jgi:hypothetical protein